jgi:GNAT superfamily N-acetyltransferase
MAGRDWPLHVRRARPDDRAAVLDFASTTFDGWDYIPRAWDAWLDAPDGALLVATPGPAPVGAPRGATGVELPVGRPIAVARVALLSPTEAWLEGIRVDPRVRGMGVASDMQVAELRWAAASGARIVRYATGERNEASHRLGGRHGFALCHAFRNWHSHAAQAPFDDDNDDEDADASGFDETARAAASRQRERLLDQLAADGLIAAPADGDRLWQRLQADPTFSAAGHLCEQRGWALQLLTRTMFDEHLARTELVLTEDDGWGLVLLRREAPPAEDVDLHLGLVAGDGRAVLRLVDHLHRLAGARVRFWLPDPDLALLRGLEEDFAGARFHGRPWTLHILCRPLDDPLLPLPDPAWPAGLVLDDEPAALRPHVGVIG